MSKPQQLPSGAWRIRWTNVEGKRQSDTFATFDLARTALRNREVETDQERERRERLGTGALTIAEAGEHFLTNRKPDANNTERRFKERGASHRRNFDRHIKPHVGDVKLYDVTPAVMRRLLELVASTKTARPGEKNADGRTLSSSTVRSVKSTLSQIMKSFDIVVQVVLSPSLKQKRRRSRPKALQSIEEVRALLEACRDPWFKVAAALAIHAGMRLGEIASLRWRHIGDTTITIETSWEGPLKARYEDDEDAARIAPLSPELAAILEAWREVTNGGADDRVVLVGGKRALVEHKDDMASKTRSACKRASVTPLTFHALRATYATLVADAGLPVSKLSALLGHADVKTTAIYIRPESSHAALDPRAMLGLRADDATVN
ncbi:MAG TPA: site-specific integrase [Kofleriaceae bacterium]|jgi:integrase